MKLIGTYIINCNYISLRFNCYNAFNPNNAYIWNPVYLDKIGQIGMYWYVLVCTCTRRYKQVQDFAVWYKSVQVSTSQYQISQFWYRTVQASTGFPVPVQDGTRQNKSVQDFPYWYRMVQDGTSQYQISSTRRYKLELPDFHSYYAYRTVQDSTSQYRIF